MAKIIVSYDDTDNDRDALALGAQLAEFGGDVSLAYVRHTQQPDQAREALGGEGGRGAARPPVPRRSATRRSPSTSWSTPRPARASGSWPRARRPS